PEMSPLSDEEEYCPSTCHCWLMLYPPRTPRNWAESVPMVLFELTSDWPTPKPISPVLDDELDLLLLLLAANAGAPSATATNSAKHRNFFMTVTSLVLSLTATCVKLGTRKRPFKRITKSSRFPGAARCIRETRVRRRFPSGSPDLRHPEASRYNLRNPTIP